MWFRNELSSLAEVTLCVYIYIYIYTSPLSVPCHCTETQQNKPKQTKTKQNKPNLPPSDFSTVFFSLYFQFNQQTKKIIWKYGKIIISVTVEAANYARWHHVIRDHPGRSNPLNAGLNPICKSQLTELFCGRGAASLEEGWRVWGRGGVFMEKVYRSSKWWEVKDWGESASELMIVKKTITRNCTQCCLTGVCLPFVHVVKF